MPPTAPRSTQAKANLDAAIAQAQGAGESVDLVTATGDAQMTQAQGLVAAAASNIAGAQADVARSNNGGDSGVKRPRKARPPR